jgi:putative spermidine/putrescine transport system permease protein
MVASSSTAELIQSDDGIPLKTKLARAERMRKLGAFALVLPLFLFLMVTFVWPIFSMLSLSVQNKVVPDVLPKTAVLIQEWDGTGLPSPAVFRSFAEEITIAKKAKIHGRVAKRLNYEISGFRSMIKKSARKLPPPEISDDEIIDAFIAIDKRWGETKYWNTLKHASPRLTAYYLLTAIDKRVDAQGDIIPAPENVSIYQHMLWQTVWMSAIVTVLCLLLGFPISFLIATLPTRQSNIMLMLVLLPFWTSLLVRTTAWVVLLQTQGLVNDLAVLLGFWADEARIQLIHNRLGVYIAMVHILLPFMVLPIFAVMKGIPPSHYRAAVSLGANPLRSFIIVYLPQTIPGVGAGVLLVFILSLGYYITPALVGGPKDQMLSFFIAFNTNVAVNWGLAAALSVVLLSVVAVFFTMYNRLVGVDNLKLS